MMKIKISNNFPQWPLERQTPNSSAIWGDCQFFINTKIDECDYWVVYEGMTEEDSVICPKENTLFITGEPESVRHYVFEFLSQFNAIRTSNKHLVHINISYEQQCLPWMVGRRLKDNVNISFSKDYDELKNIKTYEKTKLISVISSSKAFRENLKKRVDFVMALKDYFGDEIDVYGRGINDIEDKWDAIAPYKYHITLENSSYPNYWTEKLADCFLGGAYPLYFGCPNLHDYFNRESFSYIDIDNFDNSIKIIENAIKGNLYEKSKEKILESKNLVLDKYNLFPVISKLAQEKYNSNQKKELITIKPESYFQTVKKSFFSKLISKIKR